ncbi:MAG: flotillin family protein, partial [Lutibacter sp.]
MALWIILGIVVVFFLVFILPGFFIIGARDVGVLIRKNFGIRLPEGHIIACNGEVGIQADTLPPGFYWRFPILWSSRKVPVIVVNPGEVGLVKSVDGKTLPVGRLLGDEVECDSFQNAKQFLASGGFRGGQVGLLRPGTYRINTLAFDVQVQKATEVRANEVGIVVALDG